MRALAFALFAFAAACATTASSRAPDDACDADCARENDACVDRAQDMDARADCSHAFAKCRRACE